jgi:hypothetical protein
MRSPAALAMRAALDAISVWKPIWLMTSVSRICASPIGAITSRIGSLGKIGVPSGTARISPVKRKPFSHSRKAG